MGSARLATLVWPGMILAGFVLAVAVAASWPEPTTRIVRLPYGEAQPKAPAAERAQQVSAATPATAAEPSVRPAPTVAAEPDTEPARVLAAIDPADDDGPPPMPSQIELDEDYVQESPEELGADPLPGVDLTQAPPVAG